MPKYSEHVFTSLTPEQREAMENLAAAQDRTLSAMIRIAIAEYLERQGK